LVTVPILLGNTKCFLNPSNFFTPDNSSAFQSFPTVIL